MAVPRTIAYTRVSSRSQVPNTSLATQRYVLERYSASRGLIIDEVVREVGSAFREIPEEMQRLARDLPYGSRILVTLCDRFSRNVANGCMLLDIFLARGIRVIEVSRDQHSDVLEGRQHFERQIQSAEDESIAKGLRLQMFLAFKATDAYNDFVEGGSDYEESEDEEMSSSDDEEEN